MSELDDERRQLVAATRHLSEGAERIAQQKALVETMESGAADQQRAQDLLAALEGTLQQSREHRVLIQARIKTLEADLGGRGPATTARDF